MLTVARDSFQDFASALLVLCHYNQGKDHHTLAHNSESGTTLGAGGSEHDGFRNSTVYACGYNPNPLARFLFSKDVHPSSGVANATARDVLLYYMHKDDGDCIRLSKSFPGPVLVLNGESDTDPDLFGNHVAYLGPTQHNLQFYGGAFRIQYYYAQFANLHHDLSTNALRKNSGTHALLYVNSRCDVQVRESFFATVTQEPEFADAVALGKCNGGRPQFSLSEQGTWKGSLEPKYRCGAQMGYVISENFRQN